MEDAGSGEGDLEMMLVVREPSSVMRLGGLELSLIESASRKPDMMKSTPFFARPWLLPPFLWPRSVVRDESEEVENPLKECFLPTTAVTVKSGVLESMCTGDGMASVAPDRPISRDFRLRASLQLAGPL